jgi:hypothetical protein
MWRSFCPIIFYHSSSSFVFVVKLDVIVSKEPFFNFWTVSVVVHSFLKLDWVFDDSRMRYQISKLEKKLDGFWVFDAPNYPTSKKIPSMGRAHLITPEYMLIQLSNQFVWLKWLTHFEFCLCPKTQRNNFRTCNFSTLQ